MKRFALLLSILVMLAPGFPARAQTPKPRVTPTSGAMQKRLHVTNLVNPGYRSSNGHVMSGQGCISGPTANRAQTTINPITGKPQAATIVSIPITKGGGSVADSTTRAQQAQACAHAH